MAAQLPSNNEVLKTLQKCYTTGKTVFAYGRALSSNFAQAALSSGLSSATLTGAALMAHNLGAPATLTSGNVVLGSSIALGTLAEAQLTHIRVKNAGLPSALGAPPPTTSQRRIKQATLISLALARTAIKAGTAYALLRYSHILPM